MIIRSIAARHAARRVLAAPIARQWLRPLSTDQPTTATTTAEARHVETNASVQALVGEVEDALASSAGYAALLSEATDWSDSAKEPGEGAGEEAAEAAPDTTFGEFLTFKKVKRKTGSLGSTVSRHYEPGALLSNPPGPRDVTLEMLMAAQAHMGHHKATWNPANSRYIVGERGGIHIIELEQTLAALQRAARVVEEVAHAGGIILYVGTRKGQMDAVVRAAELAGGCHVFHKWTAGTITNRDTILSEAKMRVVDERDRPAEGFDEYVRKRRPLMPDLVVCLNPLENQALLYECSLVGIPTIGVVDTDMDPRKVTYVIPANDDSLRCTAVIAGVLGRAGQMGKNRRLQAAAGGVCTWENAPDVDKYIRTQAKLQEQAIWASLDAELAASKAERAQRETLPW